MTKMVAAKKPSPQLEEGYTRIANKLLEFIIMAPISREEYKICLAIIRQTYGWGKKEAEISFSLFQKLTSLDRRHAQRAVNSLLDKMLISRRAGQKMKYGKPVYKYQILKNNYSQYGYSTIANTATETVANMATIKERKKIKERRTALVDKLTAKY